jgi:hypothetical protein
MDENSIYNEKGEIVASLGEIELCGCITKTIIDEDGESKITLRVPLTELASALRLQLLLGKLVKIQISEMGGQDE